MYSFYPLPNRTPDDVYNTNNFEASIDQSIRRYSSNSRVDYRTGRHSIYGSGGISYAEIITPRPFGASPFNGADGIRGDDNPFFQIGDAVVLGPTLLLDVRYGVSRINTKNLSGDKTGFDDYDSFGVPENLQPFILFPGTAPNVNPNGFTGGAAGGGGNNWSALTTGNFNTKREFQTSHSVVASATKTRGAWIHKAGFEFRNLLSNYARPRAGLGGAAVAVRAGGRQLQLRVRDRRRRRRVSRPAPTRSAASTRAGPLLGAGLWWIRPGANVTPAFSQKYFAIYSQNDWRASSKLTVNLGLRYEIQPGPTERFDRMSAWDLEAANAVRVRRARSRSPASTATAATSGTRPTTTGARASAPPTRSTTAWCCAAASA